MNKKQIEIIRKHTPEELKGTQPYAIETLAMYTPRNANWSYKAVYVEHNGAKILVVTRFGEVL
jgi:hypothetical protein